jgi:hypothetical protein
LLLIVLFASFRSDAQLSSNLQAMTRRINSGDFSGDSRGAAGGGGRRGTRGGGERRWVDGGRGYTMMERGDLVRYDTATGQREVLMSAKELTPPKLDRALTPNESRSDGKHMLFATNPRTVMIRKTARLALFPSGFGT